jgi:hypothetical protein
MSNQVNHRRPANKLNDRRNERPRFAMGCSDEGHNGQIGRRKWVALSRRNERRNLKQGRPGSIIKLKKQTFEVPERFTMRSLETMTMVGDGGEVRKLRIPRPTTIDTGEDA